MSTWAQWRARADLGEVKKVTWVCGGERVLVDDVLTHVRKTLKPGPFDLVTLTVGSVKEREVWATLNGYPSAPDANKLVVVRNAEKITNWAPFESWLADSRRMPTSYAVLVSNERDLPYLKDKDGKRAGLPSYIESGRGKIHLVRCIPPWGGDPKKGNEGKDLIAWAQRYADVSPTNVLALMEHCGGSLDRAKGVLDKAALFAGPLSQSAIKLLASESPSDDFANSLLKLDKRQAMLALESMPVDDYSRAIGLLDVQLTMMGKIFTGLARNMTAGEMARDATIGVNHFLALKFMGAAKHYDPPRRRACRALLALHDVHLRAGARVGVLESLCAQW